MKKNYLILFILFYGCNNQILENENDLTNLNLRGNVKSIIENKFAAVEKFGEIMRGKSIEDYEHKVNHQYIFNSFGNIMSEKNGFLSRNVEKNYNVKNKLVSETIILENGEVHKKTYLYKVDDTLEINIHNGEKLLSKTKFIYITKDSIHKNEYNSNGDLEYKTISKYKNNRLQKQSFYYGNTEFNSINSYDSYGNLVKIANYDSKKKLTNIVTMKYDENNMIVENKNFYKGKFTVDLKYKYKLDDSKNWIQKVVIKDNKPFWLFERKIEYFK